MYSSKDIRDSFLNFFREKDHKIVSSAPVIPYDDPTLLFTNAGMNQFKDVFLGIGKRDFVRCADTQKCIRVSGKHNDLEEVGYDGYHHTFFEMLGNWSFGDYYKKEAIKWAWELLTDVWKLPKERLWATVFITDNEALELWKSQTNIQHDHIIKFDEKDNFWEMGETGPCGPCSEIHFDLTESGCSAKDINSNNPDVIEIWNLVFIQYNRDDRGILHDLPQKHIDTGMGFERVVRIMQKKNSNYETDVFLPLINSLINISGLDYSGKYIIPMNVISDHIRTLSFSIADGVIPSNEGRGYVIRRILRRAARYGRDLNIKEPFIYKLVDSLADSMGYYFKELIDKKDFIKNIIFREEESFNITLDRGLTYLKEEIENLKINKGKVFPGEAAFKLHDTYGFPIDLTQLLAKEKGFELDSAEFEKFMNIQKERSRASRKDSIRLNEINALISENNNYDPYKVNIDGINTRVKIPDNINEKDLMAVYIKDNPFYSESGGQVSDKGIIILQGGKELEVVDSRKNYILVKALSVPSGEYDCLAKVDFERRKNIEKNHSATHIVHEALRRVLGSHVKQMGSYLDDNILRFDFPHFQKLTKDQIKEIENIVNEKVYQNINVFSEVMPIEKAEKIPNVKKFFGEKYGNDVRIVFIDEKFSAEFCGGTHVLKTADIGLFKITKEESISTGVRRIFARTGNGILKYLNEKVQDIEKLLSELPEKYTADIRNSADKFKMGLSSAKSEDIDIVKELITLQADTINSLYDIREKYLYDKKEFERSASKELLVTEINKLDNISNDFEKLNGIKILKKRYQVNNVDVLKEIGDKLRIMHPDLVGLLYTVEDNKINIVVIAGDKAIKDKMVNAGKLAKEFSKLLGGGGGGKAHMGTAGGKDINKLDKALSEFNNLIMKT